MAPRVLIFGTGSIGAVYAYVFSRAIPEKNIVAICRSNYDVASTQGFTINSTIWGEGQRVRPLVARSVQEAVALDPTPFDYIVICSKCLPTTPSTPELIAPAVSPNTTIVLIQNGIAIEEEYAKLFPKNALLSTVVYLPATQTSPGVIHHTISELLHIGPYPASSDLTAANTFADLLTSAHATAKVHQDVQLERWSKLLINASWNPMCALSRSRDSQFLASAPDAYQFTKDVMMEIAAVAKAKGYGGVDEEMVEWQLGRARARGLPGVQPSMMADAIAGRRMEVEAIVGNAVRLAGERGVQVPLMRTIYMLARALDDSFRRGE